MQTQCASRDLLFVGAHGESFLAPPRWLILLHFLACNHITSIFLGHNLAFFLSVSLHVISLIIIIIIYKDNQID